MKNRFYRSFSEHGAHTTLRYTAKLEAATETRHFDLVSWFGLSKFLKILIIPKLGWDWIGFYSQARISAA